MEQFEGKTNTAEKTGRKKQGEAPRKKRYTGRNLAIAGTAFIAASVIGTEMFFGQFFKRHDIYDPAILTYQDLAGTHYSVQQVSFPSGNKSLAGYYFPNDSARALVLVAHGLNSSAERFLPVIMWLLDHEYVVFAFDATASGDSEGDRMIGLEQMRFDTEAAVAYLSEQGVLDKVPLVLMGHSMGAYGAATAVKNCAARVRCVISMAGFDRPIDMMHAWAEKYVGGMATVELPFLYLHDLYTPGTESTLSAGDVIAASGVPVLVIQGKEDSVILRECSLYQRMKDHPLPNVETLLVTKPGACGHSDFFLSEESAGKRREWAAAGSAATTREQRREMSGLDEDLMEQIDRFIRQSLAN